MYYERAGRAAGEAKQTLPKLFKYAMDAIFSFSYKPLRLGLVLGVGVMAFTLFLSLVNLGNTMFHLKYFGIIPGAGHIGTLLAILFLGSVQLICMGLLGEYIGRIYDEVRRVHSTWYTSCIAQKLKAFSAINQTKRLPPLKIRSHKATSAPAFCTAHFALESDFLTGE